MQKLTTASTFFLKANEKVPTLAKEKKSKEMCISLVWANLMHLIVFLDLSLSEAWNKRITYSNVPPSKPIINWGK